MRIAIDYTAAITQSAGIGRYTRNLVQSLASLHTTDDFTLFSSELPRGPDHLPQTSNIHPRFMNIGNRRMTILWHRAHMPLPAELVMGFADVIHGPDFSLPPVLRTRRVVTIHDLAFITHPDCAVPSLTRYLHQVVPRAVKAADRVIAVSQRTADDLVKYLHVPATKITTIHLGIDEAFCASPSTEAIRNVVAKYRLSQPFVLAIGTIEPRKNYESLIRAFAEARYLPDGPRMLVIAGRKGWMYEGVFAAVRDLNLADAVRFVDYVPDDELVPLLHAAAALAMPSIYEGFGIPVVEAMAAGTPVICSTGGSLPEIAGDAALIVPPTDIGALRDALVLVIRDHEIRESLKQRGHERSRLFNWKVAAQAHLDVYHQLAR